VCVVVVVVVVVVYGTLYLNTEKMKVPSGNGSSE